MRYKGGFAAFDDIHATRDDIPLLSQWIKKSTCSRKSIFWWERVDTLRPHRFDRFGRCPKRFAVLETSQIQNVIAHFGLLRRTPLLVVLISPFQPQNKKPTFLGWFLFWWERVDSNHRSRRQQIYSLPPLATREHSHIKLYFWFKPDY